MENKILKTLGAVIFLTLHVACGGPQIEEDFFDSKSILTDESEDTNDTNDIEDIESISQEDLGEIFILSLTNPEKTTYLYNEDIDLSLTTLGFDSVDLNEEDVVLEGDVRGCSVQVFDGDTFNPSIKIQGCIETGSLHVLLKEGVAEKDGILNTEEIQSDSISIASPFVSRWRIDGDNLNLSLPLKEGFEYDFTVNWGDGSPVETVTSFDDEKASHDYALEGTYTVTILGTFEAFGSSDFLPYQEQILEVLNLGDVSWKNLSYAFFNAVNLTMVRGGDTSEVTMMESMFDSASLVDPDMFTWDLSNVVSLRTMFSFAESADPDFKDKSLDNVDFLGGGFSAVFEEADLSSENYSNLLIHLSDLDIVANEVIDTDAQYKFNALEAIENLKANGWQLYDGGLEEESETLNELL